MSNESKPVELPVPSPTSKAAAAAVPVDSSADVQALFADVTKMTPWDEETKKAFLASKMHMVQTHPTLDLAARKAGVADLAAGLKEAGALTPTGPVPGGVGYGMFYNSPFKANWATGTAIYWEIICPTPPGGNVNTYLYLTATNRSAKGVEAFIAYNGQNQTFLKVFDWARIPAAPWQTNVPFANLASYVRTESAHGHPYQVLPLLNITYQSAANHWYNQVWLWNHAANGWDLIYQFDYPATLADQQTGWVGSWAPIVETFQNPYQGTNPIGALNTQVIGRASNNQWGAWHLLGSSDSYVRTDNTGFHLLFLDPNYNWAVNS
jgi:hypothetical protein